jgi:hypothetical protein
MAWDHDPCEENDKPVKCSNDSQKDPNDTLGDCFP